ncbi:MAG: type II toxin-antitoxin system RelB/DinJ family antitoxin [Defluviitaleaceae bacterium]|nr:type II toxin-antitoxin system RelB/DinJ family antitoxin [Defluviitaleaceae bacterium]
MSKATTIRIDEELRASIEPKFEKLGLNLTTYVNMALKAFDRENGIPFDVFLISEENSDYHAKLLHSIEQAKRGEIITTINKKTPPQAALAGVIFLFKNFLNFWCFHITVFKIWSYNYFYFQLFVNFIFRI